ncbi:MAG: DUF1853 family protein [Kangiellaceae bacterium]|nr:DUF1853 family protein [Kangiellaceae bacterium]MCW9000579.1 DUF1853 family protein [Kangiellaceae bacterium]
MEDPHEIQIQQILSDLHWLHHSAPIMESSITSFESNWNDGWLNSKQIESKLFEHFQNKNMKMLGTYFEALWDFYLSYSPYTNLIVKNLQVIQDKQTLGEFDFIYENIRRKSFRHLEVAVKYYLGVPEIDRNTDADFSSTDCWVGPNINDRLDLKLDKLINFQSQLSKSRRGKELLSEQGIEELNSEICLLGYLFYPLDESMKPPENSNNEHNRGYWTSADNLDSLISREVFWQVIEKPFWLSPLKVEVETDECLRSELTVKRVHEIIQGANRPVLIGSFIPKQAVYQRKDLYFIVPETWRQSAIDKMS